MPFPQKIHMATSWTIDGVKMRWRRRRFRGELASESIHESTRRILICNALPDAFGAGARPAANRQNRCAGGGRKAAAAFGRRGPGQSKTSSHARAKTTCGCEDFAELLPPYDATAVERSGGRGRGNSGIPTATFRNGKLE